MAKLWELSIPITDDPASWRRFALCFKMPSEFFFPSTVIQENENKKFCDACPVKAECLEFAFLNNEKEGIWGGTTYSDRNRIKRRIIKQRFNERHSA